MEDQPERALVRVFPDYGAEWPVWGPDDLTDPERFSPRLVTDLREWQARWEQERGDPERYRSGSNAPGRQRDLDRLARHLAAELRGLADVRTDTWSSTDEDG
ncbi:hypothetical protein [uncultured Pseudokineococcus sp.]|uniref:hypothetical protein n=1 Tax=uncultured Pseudokineococcus sp. TaxID=1642928 RepID=UPI0026283854|nr:hypothetical protein [uncultured Pseudokineococcus sp.]